MSTLLPGFVDRHGEFVVAPTLRLAQPFVGRLAMAAPSREPRFGFLSPDGHWAVEPRFDWFDAWDTIAQVVRVCVGGEQTREGLKGGRWGLVGGDGVLLEPRFEDLGRVREGLLPFKEGGRWGIIGLDGEIRLEPRFTFVSPPSDGVLVACEDGKDGYLRLDGTWLLPPSFEQAMDPTGGRLRVKEGDGWVLLDREGNRLSEAFEEIWTFEDGMARVQRDGRFNFINLEGALLSDRWFDESEPYGSGLAAVVDEEGCWFLDRAGKLHGPFTMSMPCTGGLARFGQDGKVGFLRPDGTIAIEPRYDGAMGFTSGFAGVRVGDRWTFIDQAGNEIAPPTWEEVQSFAQDGAGLAPVKENGRWGAIDPTGRQVLPARFTTLGTFEAGLAPARRVRVPKPASAPPLPSHWILQPVGGLQNTAFADLGPDAEIRVVALFDPLLDDDQLAALREWVHNLADVLKARGKLQELWSTTYSLCVRFGQMADPTRAAALVLEELRALGLPVYEINLLPFRPDPEEPRTWQMLYPLLPAVPDPNDPRGEVNFPDFETYWEAIWSDGPPPRSENPFFLRAGRYDGQAGQIRFADRMLTLHQPGIRICYGVYQAAEAFTDEIDDRAEEVCNVIEEKLAETFERYWVFPGHKDRWLPPVPLDRDWELAVETIECNGRRGYYFAIECPPLLLDASPQTFRYRENELMEAMAAVIEELDLAPVILWQRFGDPMEAPAMAGTPHPFIPSFYIVELWEQDAEDLEDTEH